MKNDLTYHWDSVEKCRPEEWWMLQLDPLQSLSQESGHAPRPELTMLPLDVGCTSSSNYTSHSNVMQSLPQCPLSWHFSSDDICTLLNQANNIITVQTWWAKNSHITDKWLINRRNGWHRDGLQKLLNSLITNLNGIQDNSSIEAVGQFGYKLWLNRQLLVEQAQIALELRMVGDDNTLAIYIIPWLTCKSKHFEHILQRQLNLATLL